MENGNSHSFFCVFSVGLKKWGDAYTIQIRKGSVGMQIYEMIIYGGGNCELSGVLEQEMEKIYAVKNPQLRLYTKTYHLENSCLEMFRRLPFLKDKLISVKRGGVQEYHYYGKEGLRRHEMKMSESQDPAAMEGYIRNIVHSCKNKEIYLIIIGQSYEEGILIDYSTTAPSVLTYEDFFGILGRVGQDEDIYFHLILDIPLWKGVTLPFGLSQVHRVASVFVVERKEPLSIFSVSEWLGLCTYEGQHWVKVLHKHYDGYRINTHPIWWRLCKRKWEAYRDNPCHHTWQTFYEQYKYVVTYQGKKKLAYTINTQVQEELHPVELTVEELRKYMKELYNENLSNDEVSVWLEEMKNCISYYKM